MYARDCLHQLNLGEKAVPILLVSKAIFSEVFQWLYKKVRVVRFYKPELLERFLANSTRMGPLEYKPRIEFIRPCRVEEQAREITEEALMLLQKLSRACSNRTREEPETEPQWTASFKTTERKIFGRDVTIFEAVLLPTNSFESLQQGQQG